MSESWNFIFDEMLNGTISMVVNVMIILVPLFLIIETLIKLNIMAKIAKKLSFIGKLIGVSQKAVFPLLVGVVMGVTYGAGTLIELNKTDPLSKRDFTTIGIFMYMCHGVIETAFLFAIIGANVWVITIGRVLLALVVTIILSRTHWIKKLSTVAPAPNE